MKKALITGITGQDGSYLAEFLLNKNYVVYGFIQQISKHSNTNFDINSFYKEYVSKIFLYHGDLTDSEQLTNIIYNIQPDEIYHLGAQSHVRVSFDIPEYTGNVTALGTTRILETIRRSGINTRFYQASSSEMFGATPPPQSEKTPFQPQSPYAVAKVYAYWMTVNYRDGYNLFACNGILFNHESPRRGETFVTRKITRAIANIVAGKQKKLYLGNLDAKRDWGYAPEYVEAMWLMLQNEKPDDYVIGTGETHTVKEFVEKAFSYVDLNWQDYIEIDSKYFRPLEIDVLKADINKAKEKLKWEPKICFNDLVKIMIDADMKAIGLDPPGVGYQIISEKGPDWLKKD